MIQAIIFDCFGVLTADPWHAFRLSLPKEQQREATDLMHQYSGGFIDQAGFVGQVAAITGQNPQDIEILLNDGKSKNLPLLNYIGELKQKGYKIGLLSNIANNWIRDSFLTPDEQALFDEMIFSYEVGMTKPDARMFSLACERLGVEPEEAVMVDDIDSYCQAAKGEGLQAIVYENFTQFSGAIDSILNHT